MTRIERGSAFAKALLDEAATRTACSVQERYEGASAKLMVMRLPTDILVCDAMFGNWHFVQYTECLNL
jgi:hypothetical protein